MSQSKDPLDRLLQAAARARQPEPAPAAFALEARVLGNWRATRGETGELLAWFRRAAIAGCVLALASLALTHHRGGHSGDELSLADSAVRMGVDE